MKQKKVEAIKIVEKEAFLIKSKSLNRYNYKYLLNGDEISETILEHNFLIFKNDKLQAISTSKELIHYAKGDTIMSVEDFQAKPTYYDDDCSDEETLRAIANKKEVAGFVPVYKDPKAFDLELEVAGSIIDTESQFIDTYINARYSKDEVIFSLDGRKIAMDEYLKLSKKYSDHAHFEKPDRTYLRFVKINGSFAFGDSKPFGDRNYYTSFTSLKEAKDEELFVRNEVRRVVEKYTFHKDITETKKVQILGNLKLIKKIKTIKSKNDAIDALIKDVSDYLKYTI